MTQRRPGWRMPEGIWCKTNFFSVEDDGVARVVAALVTHDDVGFFAEQVHDFAFAFVAPLGAHHD